MGRIDDAHIMLICDTTDDIRRERALLPDGPQVSAHVMLRTAIRSDLAKGQGVRHRYVLDRFTVHSAGNAYRITFIVTHVSYGRDEDPDTVKVWYRMEVDALEEDETKT